MTSPVYATEPHPKCSKNYQFISTGSVINHFTDRGFVVDRIDYGRARKDNINPGYGQHMVRMSNPYTNHSLPDVLKPQVVIINSHDRTKAFRVGLGFHVYACLNGLLTGDMMMDSGKLYHTGKDLSERVSEYLDVHTNNVQGKLAKVRDMRSVFLNDEEITDLTVKAATIVNPKITNQYQLAYANREDAMGRDLWTLFNNIQENAMKGNFSLNTVNKDNNFRKARPIKNVKRDIEVNSKLWNLAESFIPA